MSSIPVRRTTRVVRSTKDNENANARPSRLTTRAKAVLVGGTTATSATTRATASTAASKAKAVGADTAKEPIGAKRKREVLVEVTGHVTNNHKTKDNGATTSKGLKETEKAKEVVKQKDAVAKPKPGGAKLTTRAGRVALDFVSRRLVRAPSESTTASKAESEATVESKPSVDHVDEKMEIDDRHAVDTKAPKDEEDEESGRVFKKRHTAEKPVVHAQAEDDSQVEADIVAAELEAAEASHSAQLWDDLDAEDWDDPVMVSEYVVDVCKYLKEIEVATLPNPDYMKDQADITWEHRGVLVDWLLQVHAKFNLLAESLFLTVNVLDRFLAVRPISLSKLQLVGLACFFIATKFEETYAPSVKEIAYLSDNQYTVDEILKAERYILRIIDWDLRAPGPMGWLRRGSKADDCEVHARTIAKYLIEIWCVERRLIGMVPSLISAAALWLARLAMGREEWTPNLEHYTTYSVKELIPAANIMLEYVLTDPIPHESLYKKYAHRRHFRCSVYMRHWCLERWPENGDVDLRKELVHIKAEIRHRRALLEAEQAAEEAARADAIEA